MVGVLMVGLARADQSEAVEAVHGRGGYQGDGVAAKGLGHRCSSLHPDHSCPVPSGMIVP